MTNETYLRMYLLPIHGMINEMTGGYEVREFIGNRKDAFLLANSKDEKQVFVEKVRIEFGDELDVAVRYLTLTRLKSIKSSLLFVKILIIVSLVLGFVGMLAFL